MQKKRELYQKHGLELNEELLTQATYYLYILKVLEH